MLFSICWIRNATIHFFMGAMENTEAVALSSSSNLFVVLLFLLNKPLKKATAFLSSSLHLIAFLDFYTLRVTRKL